MIAKHRTRVACTCAVSLLLLFAAVAPARAQVGLTFAQQGRVVSAGGVPVPDGTYALTFRYYKTATATTALYEYVDAAVTVTKGLFSVAIGTKSPLDAAPFASGDVGWLGVKVGSDPELPRVRMHLVPYAVRASVAGDLACTGCVVTSAIQDGAVTSAKIAANAITSAHIGALQVTQGKIDSNAVTSGKLATDAVTTAKIANGAVTDTKIADATQLLSVRDVAGLEQFGITKGAPGLQIGGAGGTTVSFDSTNKRLTIASSNAGSVTNVTASAPLSSSGGATPNLSLTGVVGLANGGTGNTSGTAVGFSGALAGDVTGNQGTTAVVGLRGKPVANATPTAGQVLKFDGTQWKPDADSTSGGTTTGTGTANWLARWSSASALTTGSLFDDGAKVGLGTGTPGYPLHVARADAAWQARFQNGTASDVYLGHGGGYGMHLRGYNTSDSVYTLEMYNQSVQTNAFYNSGRVALGLAGNVGIGTASPGKKLHVAGDSWLAGSLRLGANAVDPGAGSGVLSLGDTGVSSTPTTANWTTSTTLLLNALDYATVGFHDSGNRVDFIRVGAGLMELGYNGGWGAATIKVPSLAGSGDRVVVADPSGILKTASGLVATALNLPAPPGDPAPILTARTVPAGQGAANERTEVILFHGNDGANGAGEDLITLRAPAIRLQTYNDSNVVDIDNAAGSNDRLYVGPTGNVGIGTSTPQTTLHVNGSVRGNQAGALRVDSGNGYLDLGAMNSGWAHLQTDRPNFYLNKGLHVDTGYVGSYGGNDLNLHTGGTSRVTVQNATGNVGVGTTAPGEKLHVAGNARTSGNVTADGTIAYGNAGTRTESRDNPGTQGGRSGFYETSAPAGTWYPGASSWQHLIEARHSNTGNNYAMQIAGSFFDQQFWVRKTNNNAAQPWARLLTTNDDVALRSSSGIVNVPTVGWYRIAVNGTAGVPNTGNRADATFTLRDYISGGGHSTLRFAVGSNFNDRSRQSFTLLSHSSYSTPTFTQVRVLTASTYDPQIVEVYVARTGSVSLTMEGNEQQNGFTMQPFSGGSVPAGYSTSAYTVDHLFTVGNTANQLTVSRAGNVGIGYDAPDWRLKVAGNAYFASTVRADDGFQVDGKQVVDSDGGWHRAHGVAGFYNETYGGGIYMEDTTWVRVYGGKHFYNANMVRADGGFEVDGLTVIDADAGWHRTYGNTGWYNGTYGGGWYMTDTTWIRAYNNKNVYTPGEMQAGYLRANSELYRGSQAIGDYIVDVINSRCYVYLGWRDSCNNCASYSKVVRTNGNGNCSASGGICWSGTAWSPITFASLNVDGDVDDNDNFMVGFRCY